MSVELQLARVWRGERPGLALALWPLSVLYACGAMLHRAMYSLGLRKRVTPGVPVISVGNLVVGGAGKTPVTLEIAQRLTAAGRRVGVLSRGYGRSSQTPIVVVSDGETLRATVDEAGDEPLWLARRLPGAIVVVGAQRAATAAVAMDLGADLLVLDDAFSHHALERTVDILVVDADGGLGNGRLLPAGPLRESAWAGRRAHLLWLTRATPETAAPPVLASLPVARSGYTPEKLVHLSLEPAEELGSLSGKRVIGVCGIARPDSFERSLATTGANVRHVMPFPDHHLFTEDDVKSIESVARAERCELIITTEKDAIRLAPLTTNPMFRALAMKLSLLGDTSPVDALIRRFATPTLEAAVP